MTHTVLIAGASGLVGSAAVDAFAADGWDVIAVSRREPEVETSASYRHVPVDLRDAEACREMVRGLPQVTHVVYTAVYEMPGLVSGWTDPEQMAVNLSMLRNLVGPLAETGSLKHVSLLQGTKAYGVHLHAIPVPARERFPRDDHQNFYWLQEDYVRELSAQRGVDWTIMRPTVIMGPNYGVVMNVLPIVGAYAAICREEQLPFGFPGHVAYVREAVDTRLIAHALRWAATAPQARGQHFNLTNGEAFSWRDLWPAMADTLGVPAAPDEAVSMADFLPAHAATWDRIVARDGLRPVSMEQLLGESHHYADFCFGYGLTSPPPPAFVSTVKIKQAGFTETWDTEESARHWLRALMERKVLPPA